jgi:uncharacterized protein (TIGR02594 family)
MDMTGWPPYLVAAYGELGQKEIPGPDDNGRILDYMRSLPGPVPFPHLHDEIAWCAAFANWCLTQGGLAGTGKWNARSYLAWGRPSDLVRGSIVVLSRGNAWQGHVAFCVETPAVDSIYVQLLGGNQGNAVSIEAFVRGHIVGVRSPA